MAQHIVAGLEILLDQVGAGLKLMFQLAAQNVAHGEEDANPEQGQHHHKKDGVA